MPKSVKVKSRCNVSDNVNNRVVLNSVEGGDEGEERFHKDAKFEMTINKPEIFDFFKNGGDFEIVITPLGDSSDSDSDSNERGDEVVTPNIEDNSEKDSSSLYKGF